MHPLAFLHVAPSVKSLPTPGDFWQKIGIGLPCSSLVVTANQSGSPPQQIVKSVDYSGQAPLQANWPIKEL
jgi:hypothetical protein